MKPDYDGEMYTDFKTETDSEASDSDKVSKDMESDTREIIMGSRETVSADSRERSSGI